MLSQSRSFLRTILGGAALSAALLGAVVTPASATPIPTISIGISQSASLGSITTVVNAVIGGTAIYSGSTSSFASVTVNATGSPLLDQPIFDTSSIDVKTTQGGDQNLYIYITEQNLSSPLGVGSFLSSFTANAFTGNIMSVDEYTFVSAANALWTGTALASHTFTAIGSATSLNFSPSLSSPFSETVVYHIHTNGAGSANDTINISDPIPEPISLSIFGMGLATLGMVSRRKAKQV
jgi:hypothetical protein